MLQKSKKSAYVMACIFLIGGIITRIVFEMLSGYEMGVYGLILNYQEEGNIIISGLIFVPILLIAAGIFSLFTYGGNDDHFGKRGAMRWALTGVIYGLLKVGTDLLISAIDLGGIGKLLEDLLGFLAIVVSYLVIFQVLPHAKKFLAVAKGQ